MLSLLLDAHDLVIAAAWTAIETTAEYQDWGSNDLLVVMSFARTRNSSGSSPSISWTHLQSGLNFGIRRGV